MQPRIVLASQSPRRRELLGRIVDSFEVIPAQCDENATGTPRRVVLQQGYDKAMDVYMRCRDALVIGADSVVTIDGEILGKPRDEDDARRMLRLLSGRRHSVLTGMCVVSAAGCVAVVDETFVEFRELTDAQIDEYIATKEPMDKTSARIWYTNPVQYEWQDKAGGYAIQGAGAKFVKRIEGDYYNVVGLPISRLYQILIQLNAIDCN